MDQAAADWWFSLLNPPCVCSAPLDVVVLVFFLQSAAFVTGRLCRRAPALAAAGKSCGGKGEKKSAGRGALIAGRWAAGTWNWAAWRAAALGEQQDLPLAEGFISPSLPLGACTGRACSSALTPHCSSAEGTCGTRCWEKGQDSISQPLVVRGKEQLCPGVAAGGWRQNCS